MSSYFFQNIVSSIRTWFSFRRYRRILKYTLKVIHDFSSPFPHHSQQVSTTIQILKKYAKNLHADLSLRNLQKAEKTATVLTEHIATIPKKSFIRTSCEFILALFLAIFLAAIIRQTWFELYEIPTGSMRPTFKEQDRVFVCKSSFGFNMPFMTRHLLFSQDRIRRGTIAVITGDELALPDVDTTYFGVFPGKRRYVKRIVALPGDWIYFYGGDIFYLQKDGTTFGHIKASPDFSQLEYIPFLHFEGKVDLIKGSRFGRQKTVELKHMNVAIARVEYHSNGTVDSFIAEDSTPSNHNKWIRQFSQSHEIRRSSPQTIGDFWGIKNFAKSRIILPEELPANAIKLGYQDPKAIAWLEIHHSPSLPEITGKEIFKTSYIPPIVTARSWIPLYEEHCDRLVSSLYTARFVVENGVIHRYHYDKTYKETTLTPPKFITDGTYEFYNGKAYQISSGGGATELVDSSVSFYPKTVQELAFWYNCGIDMNPDILSRSPTAPMPTRFAYFNNGDLLSMGAIIAHKADPLLQQFQKLEITRQAKDYSYFAFQDSGSPFEHKDASFFQTYGLKIPENQYLLLGDNHAMSFDSRYFGAVPQNNIQGSPTFVFWPTGNRWGRPPQPRLNMYMSPYTFLIVFIAVGTIVWMNIYQSRRYRRMLHDVVTMTDES